MRNPVRCSVAGGRLSLRPGPAVLTLAFAWLAGCGPGPEFFTQPAEFARQEALWLLWPTYENKKGRPSEEVLLRIIREVRPFEEVVIGVQDSRDAGRVRAFLDRNGVPASGIRFRDIPHNDIWVRDMGPVFLKSPSGRLKVLDYGFNVWGYEDASSEGSRKEEQVDRLVAGLMGLETVKTDLVCESGNLELNGEGTLLLTEAVMRQRNPGRSLADMERELRRVLGVKKILWVQEGLYEDDLTFKGTLPGPDGVKDVYTVVTTGGHIDEFARFASSDTLLLAEVSEAEAAADPISRENRRRLESAYRILKEATDQDGRPFRIVRMPLPDPLFETLRPGDGVYDYIQNLKYEDGTVFPKGRSVRVVLAASYLNYLVANSVVVGQSYWKPGRPESLRRKDETARRILAEAFPDRKVVLIDAENVNLGGGGVHCITREQPAAP